MKRHSVLTVSSILSISWVNHFLSGFISGKVPFPLSEKFRSMLQRGVELRALDVRYVSSLSWCFLMLFTIGGPARLLAEQAPIQIMPQQGRDNNRVLAMEREALDLTEYADYKCGRTLY
mmetsp:Transcript_1864/g.1294  ORF Transcript_1864/g.1294 Transcript_1864/m.1294 type:complete len:119 (-) Transcript_1864:34-390(-)